jgi:hypothetical protein
MKTITTVLGNPAKCAASPFGVLVLLPALVCFFCFSPGARAVSPTPDGLYFGANTAEGGGGALFSLTTGTNNTALGSETLFTLTTGKQNTAVGAQALKNDTADKNTAIGFQALVLNTTGDSNTAGGWRALFKNTTGARNTASGRETLLLNTTGFENTATGSVALQSNTGGHDNTATGFAALNHNRTGALNTAEGTGSLVNSSTGDLNIALGFGAGVNLRAGNNNIDIGNVGVAAESNVIRIGAQVAVIDQFGATHPAHTATYIAGITGADAAGGDPVFITSEGKLGTINPPSSARFKDDIKPMNEASETILALKPVTFRYKKDFDPKGGRQFGLIAEDVEKVAPDLVKRDRDGNLQTVRYDQVNAMLLNEFLKEHRKVEQLQKQLEALAAALKKVSDEIESDKPASEIAINYE